MPAARRHPDFEALVDDLLLRLRWIAPTNSAVSRAHPICGIGDEPVLIAYFREAKVWWLSNELAGLDTEARRWLMYELYQRTPREAAMLVLALVGAVPFPELRVEDIDVMATWFESDDLPARSIRDALALRVWLPWFASQPVNVVDEKLREWLHSHPCLVRAALVLSVGLSNDSAGRHHASLRRVFDLLPATLGRGEREVGSAIGWFLSSIWRSEPDLAEHWLMTHAPRLSRRVFRIAAGRMPSPVRTRLLTLWKSSRLANSKQQR